MGDRETAIGFFNSAVNAVNDKTNPNCLQIGYQLFSSACMADPTYATAWYQSGNNNSDLNCLPAAVANWRRALQCDPPPEDRAKILVNLGWRLHSLGRTDEALNVTNEAIRIKPDLALGWLNLSLIQGQMYDEAEAVRCAREAFRVDPVDVNNEIALAFALLFAGHYQEGFRHFEKRFEWRLKSFLNFPYPSWLGEEGKTVFLVADQGLGDTLSFARFVEAACKKSKYVHAAVQSELLRTFHHAFAHIPNLNLIPQPAPFPSADVWTTFVSLPFALGLTDEEIRRAPGILLPQFEIANNWRVSDRKLHVGIAWAGSPLNDIDRHRNIPVQEFYELYDVPGVQLYAMQVGPRSAEMQDSGGAALVRDLSPYIRDVSDTIALLRDLDLVITVESALGHIAGACAKETWIPYSYGGKDYRLGYRGKNPLWYPNHRVFCQESDAQWRPVFRQIARALRERVT